MDKRLTTLIDWVKESAAVARGLVVPVSGGSDSALSLWICRQAYPEKTLAVHSGDKLRCKEWFEAQGTLLTIPAPDKTYDAEVMRWGHFFAIAKAKSYWLVGSKTYSEELLGNYSLPSRLATYLPLGGCWKSEVMELCELVGVPEEVIASSREPDLGCGRDPKLAKIPFDQVDRWLKVKCGLLAAADVSDVSAEDQEYLDGLYRSNLFKKNLPVRGPRLAAL